MLPYKVALGTLLLGITGYGAWILGQSQSGEPIPQQAKATSSEIDALRRTQGALDARLDRMEVLLGRIAQQAGIPQETSVAGPHAAPHKDGLDSPQQLAAKREQAMREVEAQFHAEPVAGAWAAGNEKLIESAFLPGNLAAKNAPVPRMQHAACRSKTCRIEMIYSNEAQAEEGQLFLYSDIARSLNTSRPFMRTLPDGTVQLVIYASAAPLPPRR